MIQYKQGNIFNSHCDNIVITVNCVGVMGKGLAKSFRDLYPKHFEQYKELCNNKQITPGSVTFLQPNWALAATKDNWRDNSKLEWVTSILNEIRSLAEVYNESYALPLLGACNGGLKRFIVATETERILEEPLQLFEIWTM